MWYKQDKQMVQQAPASRLRVSNRVPWFLLVTSVDSSPRTHTLNHAKTAKKNQNNPWANDIPEVGFQVSIHCPASPACLVWRCTCISPINGNRTGSVLIQNHFPGKAYDSYAQAHHESSELQIRAHTQPPSDHGHLCL